MSKEENENTEKSSNILDLNTEDENFQLEETCESVSFELDKGNNHELSATDLSESITVNRDKFITDSLNVLSDDLFSLFDSSELSDIKVILKTDQILPCHKFMLRIRCPSLLVQNDPSKVSNDLDFTQYSSVATRAFFKYIYTGKIEFMYCLAKEEKSDLYILAKKYNLEFLKQFVSTAFRTESFNVYSQSTCSPPHDSPIGSPYSSQGHKDIVINELSPDLSITNSSSGLKFLNDKDYQTANESYKYPVNNEPSCSALHISRNDNISDNSFTYFSNDNSSYDIFNDEIKTPCNSSVLLMNSSQTKRRLDYTNVNEAKKVCSEPISTNVKNSSEIIILDSDSDEACLDLKTNSVSNTLNMPVSFSEVKFDLLASENLFENSNKKFNFNEPKSSTIANNEERITYKVTVVGSGQNVSSPLRNSISPVITTPLYTNTTPQKHKNSIDKYFEASFPEINENFDNIEAPFSQSTPEQSVLRNSLKNSLTPIQKIIIDNATPKPDYDSMITPDLKAELKKYGLKPDLGRKKAQALLQYIYEQIHPIKSELPRYQSPIPSTSKERTPSPSGVINVDSDDSRMNSENDFEYEEYLFNCSRERNECSTNQIGSNLRRIVIKFIKSNSELFSNVVLFRPLLLKKFYNTLKDHGVHCSLYELMDVLDDLCVNYHVEKKETTQKRRFKKKKIKIKQT